MDKIKQIILILAIAGLSVLAAKNNWLGKFMNSDKPPEVEQIARTIKSETAPTEDIEGVVVAKRSTK